ncbi:Hypothetical predicted protein, partial [Paramuricea clavata]
MVVDIANSKLSWKTGEAALFVETTSRTVNKLSVLLERYSDVFVKRPSDPLGLTTSEAKALSDFRSSQQSREQS